jgi:hypothetical protein
MKPFDAFTQSFHGHSLSPKIEDGFDPLEANAIPPATIQRIIFSRGSFIPSQRT